LTLGQLLWTFQETMELTTTPIMFNRSSSPFMETKVLLSTRIQLTSMPPSKISLIHSKQQLMTLMLVLIVMVNSNLLSIKLRLILRLTLILLLKKKKKRLRVKLNSQPKFPRLRTILSMILDLLRKTVTSLLLLRSPCILAHKKLTSVVKE
jgi:hypothetical protein